MSIKKLKKITKEILIIIVAIFIAVLFIGYKEFTYNRREKKLDVCLDDAYKRYRYNWDVNCKSIGEADGCRLNYATSDRLNDKYNKDNNMCVELYGK